MTALQEQIFQLRAQGKIPSEIAREVNSNSHYVNTILKKNGLSKYEFTCRKCAYTGERKATRKFCPNCGEPIIPGMARGDHRIQLHQLCYPVTIISDPDDDSCFSPGAKLDSDNFTNTLSFGYFTPGTIIRDSTSKRAKVQGEIGKNQILVRP
jgi:hypothetical protein